MSNYGFVSTNQDGIDQIDGDFPHLIKVATGTCKNGATVTLPAGIDAEKCVIFGKPNSNSLKNGRINYMWLRFDRSQRKFRIWQRIPYYDVSWVSKYDAWDWFPSQQYEDNYMSAVVNPGPETGNNQPYEAPFGVPSWQNTLRNPIYEALIGQNWMMRFGPNERVFTQYAPWVNMTSDGYVGYSDYTEQSYFDNFKSDYVVCERVTTQPDVTTGYGLNVYNSSGDMVYSSHTDNLRIEQLITFNQMSGKNYGYNVPSQANLTGGSCSWKPLSGTLNQANVYGKYYVALNATEASFSQCFSDSRMQCHAGHSAYFKTKGYSSSKAEIGMRMTLQQLGPSYGGSTWSSSLDSGLIATGGKETYDASLYWYDLNDIPSVSKMTNKRNFLVGNFVS
tara:strand:+ start:2421 stop:3596 length:1176 start_codon:yes stop_codon:yes gene_type:complete